MARDSGLGPGSTPEEARHRRISLILPGEAQERNQFDDLDQETFFQLAEANRDELWQRLISRMMNQYQENLEYPEIRVQTEETANTLADENSDLRIQTLL